MQEKSPDRRSESTKKWVARHKEAKEAAASDNERVAEDALRRDELAQRDYHNPMGVWIGLALAAVLVAAGLWVFNTLKCDPLESDLALVKKTSCGR